MTEYFEVIVDARTGEETIRLYTPEEIAAMQPTTEQLAAEARIKRNQLLSASDWTQVEDAPIDKQLWKTYRQALRDITTQTEFPENITWPIKP